MQVNALHPTPTWDKIAGRQCNQNTRLCHHDQDMRSRDKLVDQPIPAGVHILIASA